MRKSVRFVAAILLAVVFMSMGAGVALACGDKPCPPPPCKCDHRTPGFWKNHPEAWPVNSITVGGVTYSKWDAIELLDKSISGDKTYTMFKAVVAAKLNVLSGCPGICAIQDGDKWLCDNPLGSCVRGSSAAWKCGEPIYFKLDAYNNQ